MEFYHGGITMKSTINEQYGINVQEITKMGGFDSFRMHRTQFLIVPIPHLDDEELYEVFYFSQFMIENREPYIASMVLTKQNHLSFEKDSMKYVLLKYSNVSKRKGIQHGRDLARFHQKARAFPYQVTKTNRIGQWKNLWEKRLDQLESFWHGKVHSQPLNRFEKIFVESFPYYLGLAENAIQYLVDTEIDGEPLPIDSGTICHHRFFYRTWNDELNVKLPTEWVFDHGSRDIAEYMRDLFFEKQSDAHSLSYRFLEEYNRITPLSPFSYRLIYSRLLFPLHYFECIENYYLAAEDMKQSYEKRLLQILERSGQYEKFLKSYTNMLAMNTNRIVLPTVEWLK